MHLRGDGPAGRCCSSCKASPRYGLEWNSRNVVAEDGIADSGIGEVKKNLSDVFRRVVIPWPSGLQMTDIISQYWYSNIQYLCLNIRWMKKYWHTPLEGSFSAVSKPNFVNKFLKNIDVTVAAFFEIDKIYALSPPPGSKYFEKESHAFGELRAKN